MTNGALHRVSRQPHERRVASLCRFSSLTIALFFYTLVYAQGARSLELRCADTSVVVHSPNLEDAKSVCEGAAKATAFLGQHGFVTNVRVEVSVVNDLPEVMSPAAYGAYIGAEGRAYLLVSSKISDRGLIFDLPFEQLLYRSLAAHEVAHAITTFNYRVSPTIEAHEYIAYAVMFSTMPEVYRDSLLERFAEQQFDDETNINSFVYLMDPLRFGILAYKHFAKLENKTEFLQQVLRGRVLATHAYAPY